MAEETKNDSITIEEETKQTQNEVTIDPDAKLKQPQQLGKQQRRRQRQAEYKETVQKSFKTDEELNEIELKRQRQKQAQNQRQRQHHGPRMNRQERQIAEQWGLTDQTTTLKKEDTQIQHYTQQHKPANQDFMMSEQAGAVICDPDFAAIYDIYGVQRDKVDLAGVVMANLPQEDDAGNIEYKLRLTNLTLEKVRKRTTQMAFRLKEGHGVAYYQIGVHDSGQVIGLSEESICETLCVVFYMAQYLKAKVQLVSVGLAPSGHCIELKVTKPQPKHMLQPEIDSFLDGLSFLNKSRIENKKPRDSDEEYFNPLETNSNPEQTQHDPATKSPKKRQTSGFIQPQRQPSADNEISEGKNCLEETKVPATQECQRQQQDQKNLT